MKDESEEKEEVKEKETPDRRRGRSALGINNEQ
jgi:hypothetical protein